MWKNTAAFLCIAARDVVSVTLISFFSAKKNGFFLCFSLAERCFLAEVIRLRLEELWPNLK